MLFRSTKVADVIARLRFTIHVSFFFLLLLLLLLFLLLLFFIYIFLAVVVDFFTMNSVQVHYLRDPQTSLFSNFFIKNGSHSTIHIFKNYFATVFSVFSKISCIQTNPLFQLKKWKKPKPKKLYVFNKREILVE